jgi:hypothetical protein
MRQELGAAKSTAGYRFAERVVLGGEVCALGRCLLAVAFSGAGPFSGLLSHEMLRLLYFSMEMLYEYM